MTADLETDGLGQAWGQTRSWTNLTSVTVPNISGAGWIVSEFPYMNSVTTDNGTTLVIVSNGVNARDFDVNGSTFTEHYFLQDKLTHSGTQYTLTDTTGNQIVFWDFSVSLPSQRGAFQSFTDPDGNTVSVTSRDANGPAHGSPAQRHHRQHDHDRVAALQVERFRENLERGTSPQSGNVLLDYHSASSLHLLFHG
jgi:hypothetical protein